MNLDRVTQLIRSQIGENGLDLNDMCVFTEAATGNFAVTPVIAAMAGAKVIAVGKESKWGTFHDAERQVTELAQRAGAEVEARIEVTPLKDRIGEADIVTNLGWVRPIDSETILKMKRDSVICLMYEEWEFRGSDVDVRAAGKRGIPIIPTIEGSTFNYCGELAVKLMHDAGIPVQGTRVLVFSHDAYGPVIRSCLRRLGAELSDKPEDREDPGDPGDPGDPEVVIIADGFPSVVSQPPIYPDAEVIVIASNGRMHHTLAELGPKPVIELHTKGLKAGEEAVR